jgi:hypothetical protein
MRESATATRVFQCVCVCACVSVGEPDGGGGHLSFFRLFFLFFFLQNMSESSYELEKTRKAVAAKDLELASFKVPRHFFFFGDYCLLRLFFFLGFLFVGDA